MFINHIIIILYNCTLYIYSVTLISGLSTAAVGGALSHTKPASAGSIQSVFPLQIKLLLRKLSRVDHQLISEPRKFKKIFLYTRQKSCLKDCHFFVYFLCSSCKESGLSYVFLLLLILWIYMSWMISSNGQKVLPCLSKAQTL